MPIAPKAPKRRKEFSTFANEQVAQAALSRALARNDKAIRAWLAGGEKRFTIATAVPASSGMVYLTGSGRTVPPKTAVFVLRKDGRGFKLHTGYLGAITEKRQKERSRGPHR